ncbi:type II toxin-antitoxin system VapC family toxin [Larkinella rosea]|uniref:Type II toxin-antitoxin system VapC family toxin n=1 Tax=Larkinella rosea TaxID=2025312 RepID=A0A3P1BD46_9BACT|nr:PIN domain-containing protein [Larkinella rosea]RRA99096.1 type II toxin-antitoxin system VapC family toxin [Larkinella rosea]
MIYFDTDVLINYLIEQDFAKNQKAIQLYQEASKTSLFFCSLLCLQETAFVLSRLKVSAKDIESMIDGLLTSETINYNATIYKRGIELAKKVGFQNINDCIHTAIAEIYCQELYTFNQSDFRKIQKYTNVKITVF